MIRVGIFQNTFAAGGRIRVVSAMTRVFNDLGVVPDWIAFRSTLPVEDLIKATHIPVDARLRLLKHYTRGLSEYKFVRMNRRVENLAGEYDLLINSNNTLVSLRGRPNFIHYIHFPREARLLEGYSNTAVHRPMGRVLFSKMYRIFQRDAPSSGVFLANSEFTKSAMLEVYPLAGEDIRVVYPPVSTGGSPAAGDRQREKVVSLGRFGEDKNQINQIRIAVRVPDAQFFIMGFVNNPRSWRYFRKCERENARNGLENVRLIRDASGDLVLEHLRSASVFLHTMAGEPFGLSTVEAMSFGCIPLCHNSGGQREIVANSDLLFVGTTEAEAKLKKLVTMSPDDSGSLRGSLVKRSRQYSSHRFLAQFADVVKGTGMG